MGRRLRDRERSQSRPRPGQSVGRRGSYVDRSSLTVGEYLDEWLAGHVEVKPKTHLEYGKIIRLYLDPRIGPVRLQGLRPAEISRLYKDLLEGGGRGGAPLSP